jgi:DNA-binding CsgD family transcriptional regulator
MNVVCRAAPLFPGWTREEKTEVDAFNFWTAFPMVGHMMDTVAHADELAGRAVDAITRRDLAHAAAEFERSLTVHTHVAVQTAGQAINARLRGDAARAEVLGPQAAILFWQIPGRARIAARMLRSAARDQPGIDPVASLRNIAECAIRRSEAKTLFGEAFHLQLTSAVRGAFAEFTPAPVEIPVQTPAPAVRVKHEDRNQPSILSRREREVLCGIAEGKTNRGIAAELGIKGITVNTFVSRIFHKLDLDNRAAAAAYAVRHDLCEIAE